MADMKDKLKKYPVVVLIVGIIGVALTGIYLLSSYRNAEKVSDLVMPLIYGFMPFALFFLLLKTGVNELINRKSK
jgi:hypothetical protein